MMLFSFAMIFLAGISFGALFRKLHLPQLLGMLLAGILLGPYCFNLIDEGTLAISADLRQIALIIILLRAGLSLDINTLKANGRSALLLCFLPASFEILGMVLFAPGLLQISLAEAALLGSVVAAVSPAVVVPRMLHIMEKGYGTEKGIPQLVMAGASVDDVFVIVLFSSFLSAADGAALSLGGLWTIPVSILLGIALGCVAGLGLNVFIKKAKNGAATGLLTVMAVALLLVSMESRLEHILPYSGLLAVMAMGAVLLKKNMPFAQKASLGLSKAWVAAEMILFALVGASVNLAYAAGAGLQTILLVFAALLFRTCGTWLCLLGSKLNRKERLFVGAAYLPKATVQAAIGGVPLAMGLACGNTILTVAVLSILLTAPLGAIGIDALYKKLLAKNV